MRSSEPYDSSCMRMSSTSAIARAEGRLGIEECLEQRALRASRHQHVEQDAPHQLAGTAPAQLRATAASASDLAARLDRDADLRKQLARIDPGEPPEVAAPRALDAHRHHRRAGPRGDEPRAVVDLHQRSGDGQPPLRENDHRRAGLDQAADQLDGQRTGRVDRPDAARSAAASGHQALFVTWVCTTNVAATGRNTASSSHRETTRDWRRSACARSGIPSDHRGC